MALCITEYNEKKKKKRDDYSDFGGMADDYRFGLGLGAVVQNHSTLR
jgi:hypothetical protein